MGEVGLVSCERDQYAALRDIRRDFLLFPLGDDIRKQYLVLSATCYKTYRRLKS